MDFYHTESNYVGILDTIVNVSRDQFAPVIRLTNSLPTPKQPALQGPPRGDDREGHGERAAQQVRAQVDIQQFPADSRRPQAHAEPAEGDPRELGRGPPDRPDYHRQPGRADQGVPAVRELFRKDEGNAAAVRRGQSALPRLPQDQPGQARVRPADAAGPDDSAGAAATEHQPAAKR